MYRLLGGNGSPGDQITDTCSFDRGLTGNSQTKVHLHWRQALDLGHSKSMVNCPMATSHNQSEIKMGGVFGLFLARIEPRRQQDDTGPTPERHECGHK